MFPKTRSSRFFVFLLHFVGVSTKLRPNLPLFMQWNATGIQGVHPSTISLEISDLSRQQVDETQPHWIQDAKDQKCLGPTGIWGECGDATLWRVIPSSRRHARRKQWIRWATEDLDVDPKLAEPSHAYALQLVDDAFSMILGKNGSSESSQIDANFVEKDCLSRRRKDNKIVLVSCTQDRAWFWKVNENGVLHFDKPIRGIRSDSRKQGTKKRLLNKRTTLECLCRNSTEALLHPCDGRKQNHFDESARDSDLDWGEAVQIQFVHPVYSKGVLNPESQSTNPQDQRRKAGKAPKASHSAGSTLLPGEPLPRVKSPSSPPSRQHRRNVPSQVDIAHIHAATGKNHTERRTASRMTSILPHQSPEAVAKELPRLLGQSNPILMISDPRKRTLEEDRSKHSTSPDKGQHLSHSLRRDSMLSPDKPMIRKIQMNPYIAASKDERWTDPQTGLIYRTDLCHYLGHERRDVGRHTLVGVGQYTKTMLNIKVYGVGFYVSKRDILADPSVEPFASLSSEELRNSPHFYEILRKMDGFTGSNDPAGRFDRTLFLKTNMQLATDTMRSSLDADWKMLTPEAKELLIGSSMKPRPATEETLKIIEAPDNPSRCSCAQIAPDEYNADPSCCARGTELVFTWRKNGNLEIRLNGNFMDSFPRPDIAEGIFFEYLRMDNPMSLDFLSNVVDGFPFLLAPLSQVRGVATPLVSHHSVPQESVHTGNAFVRTIGGVGEALSSQAASFADFLNSGAHDLSSSAIEKAKSVGAAARNLGEELERKRELIGKHVAAFSNRALSPFYATDDKKLAITFDWISDKELSEISGQLNSARQPALEEEMSRFTQIVCWTFGFDSSSLSVGDVTHKLFFSLVHVYLLLLLIATFPAQWTTRTKLVVIKRASPPLSHNVSESENSDSDDSAEVSFEHHQGPVTPRNEIQIKRRLFPL